MPPRRANSAGTGAAKPTNTATTTVGEKAPSSSLAGRRHTTASYQAQRVSVELLSNRTLGPRAMVIEELILTENDYARDLEILIKHFVVPIQKSRRLVESSKAIMSAEAEKTIFLNISELLDIAYGVLNQLEQLKRQRATGRKYRVGDVLAIMSNEFKAYTVYCINFPAALECVSELRGGIGASQKPNTAFVQFEKEVFCLEETRQIDLLGYLIKPVQRIMKYPLLISELLKHTPETHVEYKMLNKALSRMEAVVRYINERKAAYEQRRALENLSERIDKLSVDLVKTGRVVLMEFNAKVSLSLKKLPTKLHHIWVFNDSILICKTKVGGDAAKAGDHMAEDLPTDRYKFVARCFFTRLDIDMNSAIGSKKGHMFSMTERQAVSSGRKKDVELFVQIAFERAQDRDKVFETVVTTVEQQKALSAIAALEMYTWDLVDDEGELCVALYDYVSCGLHADTELEFCKGDVVRVLAKARSGGLWKGRLESVENVVGIFPREFVEPFNDDEENDHIEFGQEESDGPSAKSSAEATGVPSMDQTVGAKLPPPIIPARPPRVRKQLVSKLVNSHPESAEGKETEEAQSIDAGGPSSKSLRWAERVDGALPKRARPGKKVRRSKNPASADSTDKSRMTPAILPFPAMSPLVMPYEATFSDRPEIPTVLSVVSAVAVAEEHNPEHRETMEDDWVIVDGMGISVPFSDASAIASNVETRAGVFEGGSVFYAGVFDGHGGRETADFMGRNFHSLLQYELNKIAYDIALRSPGEQQCMWTDKDLRNVLVSTFMAADDHYLDTEENLAGATAAVALVCDAVDVKAPSQPPTRWVIAANIGDARVVLCAGDGSVRRLTYDHKATDEAEVLRINTESDGFIMNNRVCGYLAITRAFGDRSLKAYGVLADPYTESARVPRLESSQAPFLIIACDGVWDVMTDTDAVDLVRNMAKEQTCSAAQWMSDKLIKSAMEKGTKDNITCIVVLL